MGDLITDISYDYQNITSLLFWIMLMNQWKNALHITNKLKLFMKDSLKTPPSQTAVIYL